MPHAVYACFILSVSVTVAIGIAFWCLFFISRSCAQNSRNHLRRFPYINFHKGPPFLKKPHRFNMQSPQRIKNMPTAKNQKPEGRIIMTSTVTPNPMVTNPILLQFLHKKSAPLHYAIDTYVIAIYTGGRHLILISIIRRKRICVIVFCAFLIPERVA
jgi:hypothetical protein